MGITEVEQLLDMTLFKEVVTFAALLAYATWVAVAFHRHNKMCQDETFHRKLTKNR